MRQRAQQFVFAANGLNVTAMDISDEALETVDRLRHPKITTVCADIAVTELGVEKYDAVFACLSLHYFGDLQTRRIIGKIYRALRPGGLFLSGVSPLKTAFTVSENKSAKIFFRRSDTPFFRPEYMKDILSAFETAAVTETEEDYFGPCAFVDAVAAKALS